MPNYYLSFATGADANDGLSWATAKKTLANVASLASANPGSAIFVDEASTEVITTITNPTGRLDGQLPIISVDRTGPQPPVSEKYGATFTLNSSTVSLTGHVYLKSLYLAGSGYLNPGSPSHFMLEDCKFTCMLGSDTNIAPGLLTLKNCWYAPLTAFQLLKVRKGQIRWTGGGILPGSPAGSSIFSLGTAAVGIDFIGESLDLSAASPNASLWENTACGKVVLRGCKLPVGWTGNAPPCGAGQFFELHNCDSGPVNYRLLMIQEGGKVRDSTSVVKQGGASDGVTALSWAVVTNTIPLGGYTTALTHVMPPEIAVENVVVGVPVTLSLDVATDGPALTNGECWIDVTYPADAGSPMTTTLSTRAGFFDEPQPLPASPAVWNGVTGWATPQFQRISVTVTPQSKGFILLNVRVGRPNATVYVDPKVVVV